MNNKRESVLFKKLLKLFETFSMKGEQNIAASIFVFKVTTITPEKRSDCFITLF